jgi:hypothetical protein
LHLADGRGDGLGGAEVADEAARLCRSEVRHSRHDRVDLRLVTVVMGDLPPPFDQPVRLRRRVGEPVEERVVGIARRHDHRGGDLGAVGERDTANTRPFTGDGRHLGGRAQRAAELFERREQRARHHAGSADGTTDLAHVAESVGERTQTGAHTIYQYQGILIETLPLICDPKRYKSKLLVLSTCSHIFLR